MERGERGNRRSRTSGSGRRRRHFHHPISAVAEDGGRAEAKEAGTGARDCSTAAAAVRRGERSGACH